MATAMLGSPQSPGSVGLGSSLGSPSLTHRTGATLPERLVCASASMGGQVSPQPQL